jgi:hypothetical protein
MKTTIFTLALAAVAAAAPTISKRDASAQQIFDSINAWINDVSNVNAFLNQASSLSGQALADGANTALGFAMDEPVQLSIESSLSNLSPDGQNAVAALQGNFGNVISGLQGIIQAPDDAGSVTGFLEIINDTRCNIVLPSLDILWPAAADASGAPPNPPPAQRPDACSQ